MAGERKTLAKCACNIVSLLGRLPYFHFAWYESSLAGKRQLNIKCSSTAKWIADIAKLYSVKRHLPSGGENRVKNNHVLNVPAS